LAFYKANPTVARSAQEFIVQHSRDKALIYVSGKEHKDSAAMLEWDLVIAHHIFSFWRVDHALAGMRIGAPAFHPSGRVVSSAKDLAGVEVMMSVNELPVGVSVRQTDLMKRVLQRMWQRWIEHLELVDDKKALLPNAAEIFQARYDKARYAKDKQWVADYFKQGVEVTSEQKLLFREALLPFMYALFPVSFMGQVPDNK
jgi:hypothetical protein